MKTDPPHPDPPEVPPAPEAGPQATPQVPRIVVIGGGVSGLAAAHHLTELAQLHNQTIDLTLLESGDRLGGVIHTIKDDDYLIEAGPDNFITTKPWAMDLIERLGLTDELLQTNDAHRRPLVVRNSRLLPVPEGFLMMAPTRWWPIVTTPLFSWPGKLRMAMEVFIPSRDSSDDESLASFVNRRFGRQALDRLIQPLVSGIYSADPESLSLRATFPQFLEMERKGSLIRAMRRRAKQNRSKESGARYSMFVTLKNGMSTLVDAMEQQLPQGTVRLNQTVLSIGKSNNDGGGTEWSIELDNGTRLSADGVIICCSTSRASLMLEQADQKLAHQLTNTDYASVAVAHLAYRRDEVPHPLDAFGFVVPAIEKSKLIATTFSSVKYDGRAPDDRVLMRAFLGGALQPDMAKLDDDQTIEAIRAEYKQLLGITAAPHMTTVHRHTQVMPQYTVNHLGRVVSIQSRVSNHHHGLQLAGNGYEGVGIPDCVHAGEQAADRLMGQIKPSKSRNKPALASL